MGQLQEIERNILEGDVEALQRIVDQLDDRPISICSMKQRDLLASYGFMGEADRTL